MSTSINKQLDRLKQVLNYLRHGATIDEIAEAARLNIEPRTLQRRLEALKDAGFVRTAGRSSGMRYFRADVADDEPSFVLHEPSGNEFSTSVEGWKVKDLINKPLSMRPAVGYNPDFLYAYRPNLDWYLSVDERRKLLAIGRTSNQVRPAGTFAKEILQRLLIDLSWNSSRLEGNTYSLLDTQQLIALGKTADGKSEREAQMILNHKDAIEFLALGGDDIAFNRYTVLNLHALLSYNLLPDLAASGRLRSMPVGITKSAFTPLAIPQKIEELFDVLLEKVNQIEDPFEQGFFMMVHMPYLQPFDDVNKRVSRMAVNIPLFQRNLSPLSFVDVPNDVYTMGILGVYELNRVALLKDVFMWAYERSAVRYAALRQTIGEPDSFRLLYREQIRAMISEIVAQGLPPVEGDKKIKQFAVKLPLHDQARFIETVETELLALHEGNFARFRILPSEYMAWRLVWPKL